MLVYESIIKVLNKKHNKMRLKVMPGINPEKCYVQKPEKMHVEESLNMPVNWFVLLVNIIADDILKLNSYDKIVFFSHLDERIGSGSTYSLKKQLLESIAVILSALTKSETSVDKKLAIATKLSDGVSQCTPGFHNRVNEVVTSLTIPDDFDALLAVQRKSIVSNAASLALSELNQSGKINKASEIHTYNRYFTIACGDGYGVRALNDNDWYHGQLHDEKIQGDLQAAFVNKFTLFHVLNGLLEQIAEIVKSRGYSGTKQDGYEYAEFSKFDNEFFASYIYISTDDLFVTKNAENATPVITDINWKNVRLALLRKLQTEKYFIFDCQEEMLLDVLFNNAEPTENTSGAIKALISNHEELMQALIFMNCHFPDKMEVLVSEYLKGKVPDDEKIVLDKIDKSNLSMANEKFQFCIKNLRLVRAASLTDAAYAKKLITQGADVNVALGLLLGKSQNTRNHQRRWSVKNDS
jgi:hypothetical protein